MANDFYSHGGYPSTGSAGASSSARAEFDAIMAGFDKMPTLAGHALQLLRVNAGATALESTSLIDGITIGSVTPAPGTFTTLSATGSVSLGDAAADTLSVSGVTIKNATNNWSIPSPSAGNTLALSQFAGANFLTSTNGTTSSAFRVEVQGLVFGTTTAHGMEIYTNNATRIDLNELGNVAVNAPSSGLTLTLTTIASTGGFSVSDGTRDFRVQSTAGGGGINYAGSFSNHAFGLMTNNTERILISATGVVTPGADNAQTFGSTTLRWNGVHTTSIQDGANGLLVTSSGTTSRFGSGTAWTASEWWANGASRVSVNSNGAVAIAAPGAGAPLTINNTANTGLQFQGSTTNSNYLRFSNTGGDGAVGIDSSAGGVLFSGSPAYSLGVGTFGATSLALGAGNVTRVIINSSGNVTVNAPSSGVALSIAGAALTPTSSQAFTATPTFNCSLSNVFEFSGAMTANVTSCTITNPTAGQTITIRVKQDGTGSRTFASPAGAKITGSVGLTLGLASLLTLTYSAMDARWEGAWTQLPA